MNKVQNKSQGKHKVTPVAGRKHQPSAHPHLIPGDEEDFNDIDDLAFHEAVARQKNGFDGVFHSRDMDRIRAMNGQPFCNEQSNISGAANAEWFSHSLYWKII